MNIFNKFLVIFLALVGVFVWSLAMFLVWMLPGELVLALRGTAIFVRDNLLLFQGLITAFGVSFILVALLILVGEVSSQEPTLVRLAQVTSGTATVSLEAMAQSIKGDLEQLPQVHMARPHIRNLHDAVEVLVELRTDPLVHLPTKAEEACQTVRHTVEERLGVKLKEVRVTIHPDSRGRPASVGSQGGGVVKPGEILVPGPVTTASRPSEPEAPQEIPRP